MQNIQEISDNMPLYSVKKYKYALELMNDNVPLAVVKRRLHGKITIENAQKNYIKEKKQMNRKNVIIANEFKQRRTKVAIIDPKSDYICDICTWNPNYHPDGCHIIKKN